MKFNKKGQGALEYLLLIGGAVLIAVIVIALLVGMGSQNASSAKERNDEAIEAIDTPIPSTITNIQCVDTNKAVISWSPVYKTDYDFQLTKDGNVVSGFDYNSTFSSTTNPILVTNGCQTKPAVFVITTKSGDKTIPSNAYVVE